MIEQRKTPVKSFEDAVTSAMQPGARPGILSPEEQAEIEETAETDVLGDSPLERKATNPPDPDALPEWAKVPSGLALPPGKQIGFMMFKAEWTDRPHGGDRVIVMWGLTVADERLARAATRGDSTRSYEELAKRMIRSVDGHRADWTGKQGPGSINRFWDEVGPKCRPLIINAYLKTHSLGAEETADFFLNCCAYRSAVAG